MEALASTHSTSSRRWRAPIYLIWALVCAAIMVGGTVTAAAQSSQNEVPEAAPWYVPDYAKAQFAGDIGLYSVGAGYSYVDGIFQSELFAGHAPPFGSEENIVSATFKQAVVPYEFDLGQRYDFAPLMLGFFANYSFGSDLYLVTPDRFDDGYYERQTALRYGPFVGGRARADFALGDVVRDVGVYWELNANDLAISNYVNNTEYFSFYDILSLGFGARVSFY